MEFAIESDRPFKGFRQAYAPEAASAGIASKPVALIPMLKSRKANWPANGRRDSAAWVALWMSVKPWRWRVAPVSRIIKNAIRFEKAIPT